MDEYNLRAKGPVAGAAKGRAAFVKLQLAQQQYIDYWIAQRDCTARDEQERLQLWQTRTELKLEQHSQGLAEYDQRIATALSEAGGAGAAAAGVVAVPGAGEPPARPCPVAKTAKVEERYAALFVDTERQDDEPTYTDQEWADWEYADGEWEEVPYPEDEEYASDYEGMDP